MASKHISRSPDVTPALKKYKTVDTAVEAGPFATKEHGVNMGHYEMAIIDVKAEGGANPDVNVLWWSEETGAFVQDNPALAKTGAGADTGYQFSVLALGRIMFVQVSGGITIGAHIATISVGGYNLDHTL